MSPKIEQITIPFPEKPGQEDTFPMLSNTTIYDFISKGMPELLDGQPKRKELLSKIQYFLYEHPNCNLPGLGDRLTEELYLMLLGLKKLSLKTNVAVATYALQKQKRAFAARLPIEVSR